MKANCTQICNEKHRLINRLNKKVTYDEFSKKLSIGKSNKKVQRERKQTLKMLQRNMRECAEITNRKYGLENK